MPEFWVPETTPRYLTLFQEPEGAPTILAMCQPRMVDGFYVPLLTLPYLAFYWGQCAMNDHNGTWHETVPRFAGHDNGDVHDLRLVIPGSDGDTQMVWEMVNPKPDPYWTLDRNEALFAVDRLPWQDGEKP